MRELCDGPSGTATEYCALSGAPSLDVLWGGRSIAEFLGCSVKQLYRLAEDPKWPFFKANGKLCARRSALAEFIRAKERRLCA